MIKINARHDDKDQVICVTDNGKHSFYYRPANTLERIWLFDTKTFSGSIFVFFRKHGRNLGSKSFSMSLKELYELGNTRNCKINKIMDRIPRQIEYVLREDLICEPKCRIIVTVKRALPDRCVKMHDRYVA